MADQVPPDIKTERAARLKSIAEQLRDNYYQSLRGRELQVLVEPRTAGRPGFLLGTSCRYAPVEVPAEGARIREFVTVRAGDVTGGCIQSLVAEGHGLARA